MMKTRNYIIAALLLGSTGCAGTIQFASMSEAYEHYEEGEYQKTIGLIAQAENARALHPEQRAALTYLKAQSYEALGEPDIAAALYAYLKEQHSNTQYAYLIR